MKKIKTVMVDFLKLKNGDSINIRNMALNEAEKLPDGFITIDEKFQVRKIENPNKAYTKFMIEAEIIDFELDKYDYYTVQEISDKISVKCNATWNLRVLKDQAC